MSVQDIIFSAAGGSSTTSSIEYAVGVYDLPITANWSQILFANDKTVIVGVNQFVTITDPVDQSTMVSGTLPKTVSSDAKLVYANNYLMIPDATNQMVLYSTNKFTAFKVGGPWKQTWANGTYYSTLFDIAENGVALFTDELYTSYNYRNLVSLIGPTRQALPQFTTVTYSSPMGTIGVQGSSRFNSSATAIYTPGIGIPNTLAVYTNKKQLKNGKLLPSTTSCHAYDPVNKKYMAIGKDGFIYESSDGSNYVKNTATVIPAGVYKDMTFAGGKFCAAIYNTNKFVVIGDKITDQTVL